MKIFRHVSSLISLVAAPLLIASCSDPHIEQSPAFHPLEHVSETDVIEYEGGVHHEVHHEFITISNPPSQPEALQTLIDSYNEDLRLEGIGTQRSHVTIVRHFYRQSDDDQTAENSADLQEDDFLMTVEWTNWDE